jgi:hypothetical protein
MVPRQQKPPKKSALLAKSAQKTAEGVYQTVLIVRGV